MKLYMHPVSMTSRPVRLFIAENKIPVDEVTVDLFTGAQYQPPYVELNPNSLVPMIEDPAAVLDARTIVAATPRVCALITGGEDLATSLGAEPTPE